MTVDIATAKWKFEHEGETTYFCAKGCLNKYAIRKTGQPAIIDSAPSHPSTQAPAPSHPRTLAPSHPVVYICPMDPEIRQEGPGDCPICGMPLEPEMPSASADDATAHELRDLYRRLWVSVGPRCR
jgi:Cu+-exporting ATPase